MNLNLKETQEKNRKYKYINNIIDNSRTLKQLFVAKSLIDIFDGEYNDWYSKENLLSNYYEKKQRLNFNGDRPVKMVSMMRYLINTLFKKG